MEPQWHRLASYVSEERRLHGWTQAAVRQNGGPSTETQRKIEAGDYRPNRGVGETLGKIDTGLHWEPGSASDILAGGEPTRKNATQGLAIAPEPRELTIDELIADALAAIDELRRPLEELRRRRWGWGQPVSHGSQDRQQR